MGGVLKEMEDTDEVHTRSAILALYLGGVLKGRGDTDPVHSKSSILNFGDVLKLRGYGPAPQ